MTRRSNLSTRRLPLSTDAATATASLGVLSVHLDGNRCRVGCEFCYLGLREGADAGPLPATLVEEALARLSYDEVAVAVSEPVDDALAPLRAIAEAAHRHGRPVAVTTTMQVAASTPGLLDGIERVNLSVDPRKGRVSPERIDQLAASLRGGTPRPEVVLIVSLTTPEFAARLVDGGLLAELVDLPHVDKVALNALKPPPPWCDRAFWLRTLAALAPLLERALDRRLFLDCYVAARILQLGGCPARADLSPAIMGATIGATGGLAFRGCVYQPAPDFVAAGADELAARLSGFTAPPRCPFPIV